MEQMTERQTKDWARGLIIEGHRQGVQVTIYTNSKDPEEQARCSRLCEILRQQKEIFEGEEQLAKLVLYYFNAGMHKELRELLADDEKKYRAYRTVAERELYRKLDREKDSDKIQKALTDPDYEMELIQKDPDLAGWVPDWIMYHLRKYDEIYAQNEENEDDLEEAEENTTEDEDE